MRNLFYILIALPLIAGCASTAPEDLEWEVPEKKKTEATKVTNPKYGYYLSLAEKQRCRGVTARLVDKKLSKNYKSDLEFLRLICLKKEHNELTLEALSKIYHNDRGETWKKEVFGGFLGF